MSSNLSTMSMPTTTTGERQSNKSAPPRSRINSAAAAPSGATYHSVNKEEKSQHIQVAVRIRPLNENEKKHGATEIVSINTGKREVICRERASPYSAKTYTFDKVFGPNSTQIEVYREVVLPILDEVLMGYNCTIFAYGQTGAGKTFTMEGERTDGQRAELDTWENDPLAGIIPRTLHQLFETLTSQQADFTIRTSFVELYNEELLDLLASDSAPPLRLYDDPVRKGSVVIQGLEEVIVRSKDEVYKILERGANKRATASTLLNSHSSRSHSVFSVIIHIRETAVDGEEMLKTGKLYMVDLAGSENIGRSGAVGKRATEAGNINQSLLTLGRVITALVEHGRHIPYRESKLTRLLQDSLGGKTKTCIIATVTPSSTCQEETISTLDYACRAKNITNKPEINQKVTKKALLREYAEEIERLRRDLQATREKSGVFLADENYQSMVQQLAKLEADKKDLEERLDVAEQQNQKAVSLFSKTESERDVAQAKLRQKEAKLEKVRNKLTESNINQLEVMRERDETKFLLTEHQDKENVLFDQAQELVSVNEKSTQAIQMLHGKLDRTKAVQEANERHLNEYRSAVMVHVDDMKESLNSFCAVQQEVGADETKQIETLTQGVEKRSLEVKASLVSLKTTYECKMVHMSNAIKTNKASLIEMQSGMQAMMKLQMELMTKMEVQAKMMTELAATLEVNENEMVAMQDEFGTQINGIMSHADEEHRSAKNEIATIVTIHQKRQELISSYEDNGNVLLQSLGMMTDELVNKKIAKDSSTGQTPSRQSTQFFRVQKELARASPPQRLIERFREQYEPPVLSLDNSILDDTVLESEITSP